MGKLTEDVIHDIERVHSTWIELEVAGQAPDLLALCADDIELWPPDAPPVIGRAAVSAQLTRGNSTRIHAIEISDRRIRGTNEIAYLTANYRTSFSTAENPSAQQLAGSHLWILQNRAGSWLVTLVSWSLWEGGAV